MLHMYFIHLIPHLPTKKNILSEVLQWQASCVKTVRTHIWKLIKFNEQSYTLSKLFKDLRIWMTPRPLWPSAIWLQDHQLLCEVIAQPQADRGVATSLHAKAHQSSSDNGKKGRRADREVTGWKAVEACWGVFHYFCHVCIYNSLGYACRFGFIAQKRVRGMLGE